MNSSLLDLVAYAIVAVCAVLAWRKFWPRKASAGNAACGGCSGCSDRVCRSAESAPGSIPGSTPGPTPAPR